MFLINMDIHIQNNNCNTNFYGIRESVQYIKNRHTQRIVRNAFDMYRDSFKTSQEGKTKKSFNFFEKKFKRKTIKYFDEFKRTQPFMPTTKFPSASSIKKHIQIKPDGSTNIEGVFVDKDGLVILDFDRISNWESIGFPKGTVSKGIEINDTRSIPDNKPTMNIGNIRFFSHGLYPDKQNIEGFESCTHKGSEGLLSFNYGCRSDINEFFFPIGIISHLEPQNIVGGQNSWNSYAMLEHGFKKTLNKHIQHSYVESKEGFVQRNLLADLTKKPTKLTEKKYVEFVEQYAAKPIQDIQPQNWQAKIMESFANLNAYIGGYRYDEIYGLEPVPMGIFLNVNGIPKSNKNLIEIVEEAFTIRPVCNKNAGTSMSKEISAIKDYALKKDIPCVVFNTNKIGLKV